MSFEKLKETVMSGSWDIGSKHNGNPAHNDLIRAVGERHKVGFFESIHKFFLYNLNQTSFLNSLSYKLYNE